MIILQNITFWTICVKYENNPTVNILAITAESHNVHSICFTSYHVPPYILIGNIAKCALIRAIHESIKGCTFFWPKMELIIVAAARLGSVYTVSISATTSIEDICASAPDGRYFQQIYWPGSRQATRALAERAEQAGCIALVLTVDVPGTPSCRWKDMRNQFSIPSSLTWVTLFWLNCRVKIIGNSHHECPPPSKKKLFTITNIFISYTLSNVLNT